MIVIVLECTMCGYLALPIYLSVRGHSRGVLYACVFVCVCE